MKSMLNKTLAIAFLFVAPAMVAMEGGDFPAISAADADVKGEAAVAATEQPSYWSRFKSGCSTVGNTVADYTYRTRPVQFVAGYTVKPVNNWIHYTDDQGQTRLHKTKAGALAAGYAAGAVLADKYAPSWNSDSKYHWKKAVNVVTAPFWAPVYAVRSGYNWLFPSAMSTANKKLAAAQTPEELVVARQAIVDLLKQDLVKAEAVLTKAQAAQKANASTKNEAAVKAAETVVAEAKKAVAKAEAELKQAQDEVANAKKACGTTSCPAPKTEAKKTVTFAKKTTVIPANPTAKKEEGRKQPARAAKAPAKLSPKAKAQAEVRRLVAAGTFIGDIDAKLLAASGSYKIARRG